MCRCLIPELKKLLQAIEHRNLQVLEKRNPLFDHKTRLICSRETHLWLPCLCLLSARVAAGINTKALQLVGLFHLLSYGTELHWSVPKENNREKQRILWGDLVNTQIYIDICSFGLEEYLPYFSSLISGIHEHLAMARLKGQETLTAQEHEIKAFAMMSESACYLGAHVSTDNSFVIENLKKAGYQLGIIKALSDRKQDYSASYTAYLTKPFSRKRVYCIN